MSTRSCPTSSSPARSTLLKPPSYSSSSSSSFSSTSSSNKVISVGAVETAAPRVEEVRGNDVGNASDRSILLNQVNSSFEESKSFEFDGRLDVFAVVEVF